MITCHDNQTHIFFESDDPKEICAAMLDYITGYMTETRSTGNVDVLDAKFPNDPTPCIVFELICANGDIQRLAFVKGMSQAAFEAASPIKLRTMRLKDDGTRVHEH